MSAAGYGFLSVLRRGLAALTTSGTATDPRVAVPVSLSVGGQAVTGLPKLALRGPGDVVGFDAGAVCRTWPARDAINAEPNYFALAELREPDLPWRYTPDATSGDRLAPWLCLIVVEDSEIAPQVPATRDRPLAALTVNDATALPDLSQAWAWAHAQIVGAPDAPATDFDIAAVGALLASDPSRAVARLLCPRRLEPHTRYLACVVPTFERGRRAGLGQAVDGVGRLVPAWSGAAPVTLPVYYSWRFETSDPGDFASLVAKLKARGELPDTVWRRDLAVNAPGVDPPSWLVVGLEGALKTLDAVEPAWSTLDTHGFTAALASRVNAGTTVLAPTLYGRWLAAAAQLSTSAGATPPWFHELNADPRARVAAGLGTLVVQSEQEALLAGAWAQVDGIRRINDRLRWSQLAREAATRLYVRHFSVAGDIFLQLTAPLHGQVHSAAGAPPTVRAQLAASAIAPGAVEAAWRRAARPFGSLGVRQGRPRLAAPPTSALARMTTGALAIVPAPPTVTATGAAARLGDLAATFQKVGVQPEHLAAVAPPAGFTLQMTARSMSAPVVLRSADAIAPRQVATLPSANASFAQAAGALMAQLATPPASGVQWTQPNLDALHSSLATALHPKQTIEAPLAARLSGPNTGSTAGPTRTDPIEPVMAAPDFPQAMYEPLAARSTEWMIPGLDQIPPDTVALLATNWRFVEAYLVGLNHELARKLLWNGYPTDQRGTYFRHFWDLRSRTDGTTDGDVGPIQLWTGALGANRARAADPLVLLVRGELIRRYPNLIVYAAQAIAQNGARVPGPTEKQPIFFARLDPDVALFGFDLDPTDARGNPGWFFILQEHPSEPRFGLASPGSAWGAQPATWQALGWDHLAANADALAAIRCVDLAAALPKDPATPDPTGAVWHASGSRAADLAHITFRTPKRLAIHASTLVPDGSTPKT